MMKFIRWFNKEFEDELHSFEPVGILFFTLLVSISLIVYNIWG